MLMATLALPIGTVAYGQTAVAVDVLETRAIEGDTEAMYRLGEVLLHPIDAEAEDRHTGLMWLTIAHLNKHPKAKFSMADFVFHRKPTDNFVFDVRRRADWCIERQYEDCGRWP